MVVEAQLNDSFEQELASRGYSGLTSIGEGQTSEVYRATYAQEGLIRPRIVKVEKLEGELDPDSPTTRINMAKRDVHSSEILTSNQTSHPNLVDIQDCFVVGGRRVIVEEDVGGQSLEDLVEAGGPITDPVKFGSIFSGVLGGMEHLHCSEKLVHRDIKPSNIVVGRPNENRTLVKLIDLQNAGPVHDELDTAPTRCGTAYANDHLIASILSGEETRYEFRDEFYSLGATMYYALTGKPLHDRHLVQGDGSKVVQLADGTIVPIALVEDGDVVDRLDVSQSKKKALKKVKKLPARYKGLVRDLIDGEFVNRHHKNFGTDPGFNHQKLKDRLERTTKPTALNILTDLKDNSKIFLLSLGVTFGIIGGLALMHDNNMYKAAKEVSLAEILSHSPFETREIKGIYEQYGNGIVRQLAPTFKEIKDREREHIFKTPDTPAVIDTRVQKKMGTTMHLNRFVSDRLASSLIGAILLSNKENLDSRYANERYCGSYVPREFVERILNNSPVRSSRKEYALDNPEGCLQKNCTISSRYGGCHDMEFSSFHHGLRYLRHLVAVNGTPEEVFSEYFVGDGERLLAQSMAGSTEYFDSDGEKGYSSFLDPVKKGVVDKAIALYYITDGEGKVHTHILDDNNVPSRGLDARYSCFIESEE